VPLPERVAESVRRALARHRLGRIERMADVGGGCINHGARLETESGATLFLKWNRTAPLGMFEAEADGLAALAKPGAVRVPTPIAWSGGPGEEGAAGGPSWLLLEWVSPGRTSRAVEELLGVGLARLHASRTPDMSDHTFGWRRDNWIGSLPQDNAGSDTWSDFWRIRRIEPQLRMARERGHLKDEALDRVLDIIPEALADITGAELLHGDLWGGNWFPSEEGTPVLIDPAVYLGHGEVDLAMSQLFGGFGPRFYEAYRAARRVSQAYEAYRRDLYQLYYLLVHVNLFGASYEAGSLRAARRVVSALSG